MIPVTHCQQCADPISLFNKTETICNNCVRMNNEIDFEHSVMFSNKQVNPEQREYTLCEQRRIRKVVAETAHNDIRAAYSLVRRLLQPVLAAEEFAKAQFLRQVRLEIITSNCDVEEWKEG